MTPINTLYTVFFTSWGWMGLLGSTDGLKRVVLPRPLSQDVEQILMQTGATNDKSFFGDLPLRFNRYFSGEIVVFDENLDIKAATPFRQLVWTALCKVPYGETRSYHWLAEQVGNPQASRAVGQALGANPIPIVVPCHRIITSQGELGGFAGGQALKRRLLELEQTHR